MWWNVTGTYLISLSNYRGRNISYKLYLGFKYILIVYFLTEVQYYYQVSTTKY